jgi:hypothetical protein
MGLFDILKKKENASIATTDNGVLGPIYLDGLTTHIDSPKGLKPHEWRRKLKSQSGQTKFKIKYYGQLHSKYKNLIVGTDFSKPLIIAIDPNNNEEVLLWDGCKYGYNPIFCDEFTHEQITNREANIFYQDKDGKDTFDIIISTYHALDLEHEFGAEIDENEMLAIDNGRKIKLEEAKRNGFDCLSIDVINENGRQTEIVSEELA